MRKPPLQDVIVKTGAVRNIRRPQQHAEDHGVSTGSDWPAEHPRPVHLSQRRELRSDEYAPPSRQQYDVYNNQPPMNTYDEETYGTNPERKWFMIALGVGTLIVTTALALSYMFAGASVVAYPKQDSVVINTSFLATRDGVDNSLVFKEFVLERTATKVVAAQSEQEVEERASGEITVYNAYAESPQRLIKNTRFQSKDGKVFRIRESIEVPGKKSDTEPGSINVLVYAEEPGEEYNIAAGDFSIPGFSKLPQEGKVYAKSTQAFTGGFKGSRRVVAEQDRQEAMKSLEQQLRDELLTAAFESKDRPEGYLLFKEAVFFEFNPTPDVITGEQEVSVSLSGKIHGLLFQEDEFAKRLASLTIGSYSGTDIRIDNPYELSVTANPNSSTPANPEDKGGDNSSNAVNPAWQSSAYDVRVEGKAHFIWEFDANKLIDDLVGKEKTVLDAVDGGLLEAYPGIDRIHATVRPFWKSTFPSEKADIVVVTELDS